jgi:hypothetical protein
MYTMHARMSPFCSNFCDVMSREQTAVPIADAAETGPATKAMPRRRTRAIVRNLSPRRPGWEMPIVRQDDPHHSHRRQRSFHQPRTIPNLTILARKVNQLEYSQ